MNNDTLYTPAERVMRPFLDLLAANQLIDALANMPARTARTAIRLIIGVPVAHAAGLYRPGIAPIELNWLGESFTADMQALADIARRREGIPQWTQERLTVDEIAALLAEAWLQPFSTLETPKQALIRIEMERRASM